MKIVPLHSPYCYICKNPSPHYTIHSYCKTKYPSFEDIDQIIVWAHYDHKPLQTLIKDVKYYGKYQVLDAIVPYVGFLFIQNISLKNFDSSYLTFAPMHFWRRWKRGFNHSEVLAGKLSTSLDMILLKNLIQKTKHTKQQSKLSFLDRRKNLYGVYKVNKHLEIGIVGKDVIIVDDVISTGATLCEIAKVLKKSGAKKIIGLVIASD